MSGICHLSLPAAYTTNVLFLEINDFNIPNYLLKTCSDEVLLAGETCLARLGACSAFHISPFVPSRLMFLCLCAIDTVTRLRTRLQQRDAEYPGAGYSLNSAQTRRNIV